MERHDHPGLFLAVEGLDGSGSSQFAALFAHNLELSGYRVVLTKEPTQSLVGGLIRAQLHGEWRAGAEALQLLFTADRALHLEQEILPALEAGKIVISDRYAFSSIAYGAVELGDPTWLQDLNRRFILPDQTFLIQVSPKICAMRIKASHYEAELYSEEKKLQRVWQGYEALAAEHASIKIIRGERTELEVVQEMKDITSRLLSGTEVQIDGVDRQPVAG